MPPRGSRRDQDGLLGLAVEPFAFDGEAVDASEIFGVLERRSGQRRDELRDSFFDGSEQGPDPSA